MGTMYKIKGFRGTGKTTKLLIYAHTHNCILVEPTYAMTKYAQDMAKDLGYEDVRVIHMDEFLRQRRNTNYRYVLDEIDAFLYQLRIAGYSEAIDGLRYGAMVWDDNVDHPVNNLNDTENDVPPF